MDLIIKHSLNLKWLKLGFVGNGCCQTVLTVKMLLKLNASMTVKQT